MEKEPVQVASLTEVFLTWVQSNPEQVVFLVATYVVGIVLLKKDRVR